MLAFIRSSTALRVLGCIAGIGIVLTILAGTVPYNDPCTTANRGLPLPIYSNNCECMEHVGPEWHLGNAFIDWALFSVLALVFLPLIRRALNDGSRS
jgi:hypothetical protein